MIDPQDIDEETAEANIALTARLIRKTVIDARHAITPEPA